MNITVCLACGGPVPPRSDGVRILSSECACGQTKIPAGYAACLPACLKRRDFVEEVLEQAQADGVSVTQHQSPSQRLLGVERAATLAYAPQSRPTIDLIAIAEYRAGSGPVTEIDDRNLVREAVEELADCRNYLVWLLSQCERAGPDLLSDVSSHILKSLAFVAYAFGEISQAAELISRFRERTAGEVVGRTVDDRRWECLECVPREQWLITDPVTRNNAEAFAGIAGVATCRCVRCGRPLVDGS